MAQQSIWTVEREEQLREMWPQRANSARKIAAVFGCTRSAVIGKAHRLGLPPRFTTPDDRRTAALLSRPKAEKQRIRLARKPMKIAPPAQMSANPVSLADLTTKHCRFPLWGAHETSGLFCGDPPAVGPYCTAHAEKCYTPEGQRKLAVAWKTTKSGVRFR